jgi:SOS-response transcriptional repressor LexA
MTESLASQLDLIAVPRILLKLRAGITGFEIEPDLTAIEPLAMPAAAVRTLKANPASLLALRVRDEGMEPMLFEDDWVVLNVEDTAVRSGEIYAVNWNGEPCVQQLVQRGGQWFLSYLNPAFHPINIRSGQLQVVGRVVYQAGRLTTGRL